ncbi:hypothetical protein NE237_016182 [Protea cynaroides]|uniref:Uncharacterized protein n=1 Tax=Protea cynaroides TaxID=273540 RepID=A0A9Q0KFP8_9MAGN|nr:hypothetical protein NE237_016182 [Protea cynaroides]
MGTLNDWLTKRCPEPPPRQDHLNVREGKTGFWVGNWEMKPSPTYFYRDLEDDGSTVAMDGVDADLFVMLAEGFINFDSKLAGYDFFNAFEDDFDDSDIS